MGLWDEWMFQRVIILDIVKDRESYMNFISYFYYINFPSATPTWNQAAFLGNEDHCGMVERFDLTQALRLISSQTLTYHPTMI